MLTYTLLSMLAISAPADKDEAFVHIAATHCKNAKKPVDKRLLRGMMQLETWLKVPKYARGITLAAACRESGYRADPRRGDGGKAVGILQMWPWWEKAYPFKRTHALRAVEMYLRHVNKATKKARRLCKGRRAWFVAQAWTASGPKGWRCRYSRHVTLLRRWKRMLAR